MNLRSMLPTSAAALVSAWLVGAASATAGESFRSYDGQAVDLDAGMPIYAESHFLRLKDGKPAERVVLYKCPGANGQPFARKHMQIGADPLRPTFEMRDARIGYVEGLRENAGVLEVYYQRDRQSPLEAEPLVLPEELVADAGFDDYVRKHWKTLLADEKVQFDFLVPSRLEYLGFKVKRLRSDTEAGRQAEVFRLSLSGAIGWFLSGIDVWYAADDQTLLRFDGLSNVRNPEGENYKARIVFPAQLQRAEADGSALAAALSVPLVERCP